MHFLKSKAWSPYSRNDHIACLCEDFKAVNFSTVEVVQYSGGITSVPVGG